MPDFKPGGDPINIGRAKPDVLHVGQYVYRYESMRITDDSQPWQGPSRWEADVRKDKVEMMQTDSYKVNAPKVAEAILERLLAGAVVPKRPDQD